MRDLEKTPKFFFVFSVFLAIAFIPLPVIPVFRGAWRMLIILSFFLLFAGCSPKLSQYRRFVWCCVELNPWVYILYIYFCFGVFFAYLRGGEDWKFFIQLILGGYMLIINPLISRRNQTEIVILRIFAVVFACYAVFSLHFIGDVSARDIYQESRRFTDDNFGIGSSAAWATLALGGVLFFELLFYEKIKIIKFAFLVVIAILGYMVFRSGFATPAGLFFVGLGAITVLFLVFLKKKSIGFYVSVVLFSLTLLFLLVKISFFITSTEDSRFRDVSYRINNFIEDPLTGGYDSRDNSRFWLAKQSIDTFIGSPFFGGGGDIRSSAYTVTGGHASLFDYLAIMGGVGGGGAFVLLMLLMLYNNFRGMCFERTPQSIIKFVVFSLLFFGGIVNPYWYGPPMMFAFLFANNFRYPKRFRDENQIVGFG